MQEQILSFECFAENSPDGIFITDKQHIVYTNRAMTELLAYTPEELLGIPLGDILMSGQEGQDEIRDESNGILRTGQFQAYLKRRDGSQCPVEATVTKTHWHDKTVTILMVRDITERVRKEAELREIESLFLQITDNINEVFFVRDPKDSRMVYISPAYERIWRRPIAELVNNSLSFMEYIHPEDKERIRALVQERDSSGQDFAMYQYRIIWPSGEVRWIRVRTFPVMDKSGHPYRVAGIAKDITTEKIAEEKLRMSEMQLRQIIDLVPVIIFVKNQEGRFLLVNKATADFHGTSVDKLTGASLHDLHFSKDHVERIMADDQAVLDSNLRRLSYDEVFVDANGSQHTMNLIKIPFVTSDQHQKAVLGVAIDVTERKHAEAALYKSEERLRRSLYYTNIGIWDWNIQNGELYWSEQVAPLFGHQFGATETSYEAFLAAVHPEDRRLVENAVQSSIDTGLDYDIEHRVVWPDGSVHWVHEAGGVVHDADGKPERMLGIVGDITRRKMVEQSLVKSESKYRAVMENASDAILLGTMDSQIIDANHRAEELFGYTRQELLKLDGRAIHPEEDHPTLAAAFNDLALTGNSLYEHLGLRKDGTIFNIEVAATVIDYLGEKVVIAIFRDTTARKHAEKERLAHAKAQRDTLVREVHHRIKNNLQGVVGLLRQHTNNHPETREPLESAIGQVNSMSVVHGLFGRASSEHIVLCEMTEAICKSAGGLMGKKIDPHLIINVETPIRISTDEAVPLALILNELIFNAVKHQTQNSEPVQVFVHDEADGASIRIVTPGTTLPRDFDFSRSSGLGTGLELVKSLLPPNGCQLSIFNDDTNVLTELRLNEPVLLLRLDS